jgi:hypothetical protein
MKNLIYSPIHRISNETLKALTIQEGSYFDIFLSVDNPYTSAVRKNIQLNYEKMRRVAVTEGYDKVFIVESDMLPEKDALKKLLEVNAQIVSGLYPLRHGSLSPNIFHPSINGIGSQFTWEEIKYSKEYIVDISGGCMGCLLVDIEVLKGFNFEIGGEWAPDTAFSEYCVKQGFTQKARLDVQCGHIEITGKVLYPSQFII